MEESKDMQFNLKEMLQRTTISTLASVPIPEYKAWPSEDVYDFLHRFEIATLIFTDELRCLALYKALKGAAYIWAKNTVSEYIQKGDWKSIKSAIIERFAPPDQELKIREALSKMKYDPKIETLTSFVEHYADRYKRVYQESLDKDIIRNISFNLPSNVLRHLNLISNDWSELEKLNEFYELIRRIEHKILPYEQFPDQETKINAADVAKLFLSMKDSIERQIKDVSASKNKSDG